jgi:hypothetical protein
LQNVSFYTGWTAYNPKGDPPVYSGDVKADPEQAQRFVDATESLWEEASEFMRDICPGQFRELARAKLPAGMTRLAGVWTGFAVNGSSEEVPIQTEPHRDYKSVFFSESCLCPFGNFRGDAVILWELRAVLELEAGDLFVFEDHLLTHSNEKAIGERHSLVAFMHQSVLDWHYEQFGKEDPKKATLKARKVAYRAEGARRKKESENRRNKAKKRDAEAGRAKTVTSGSVCNN